jgi:hypothetical protein
VSETRQLHDQQARSGLGRQTFAQERRSQLQERLRRSGADGERSVEVIHDLRTEEHHQPPSIFLWTEFYLSFLLSCSSALSHTTGASFLNARTACSPIATISSSTFTRVNLRAMREDTDASLAAREVE